MQNIEQPWYRIIDIAQLDSPALVIYPERVKHNIKTIIDAIDNVDRLRPHIKTHKSKEVTALMMAAGINKFKCATIAEAELLGLCKAADVLLAYQPYGPKLERFIALIKKYRETKYSCLVDNLVSAQQMDAQAKIHQLQLEIYIDLNVGQNRTGIKPDHMALALYEEISKLKNLTLMGLHAYDGHIYETNLQKRTIECTEIYSSVAQLKNALNAKGFKNINLIMGGSPSFPIYAKLKDVECSPGTFVFWDRNYLDTLPEQHFLPAALVIGRIVSMPGPDKICLDIGHKSIAAENELFNRVLFLNAPDLELIGQSEEHLVAKVSLNHSYQIGDVFYGMPFHVCPTCALYSKANLVENGQLVGDWEITARERKIEI
jgi:D-serine deaminase-like pyridoxal phosphate-dependent protein